MIQGGVAPLPTALDVRDESVSIIRPIFARARMFSAGLPVPLAPVIALTRGYERMSRRPRIRVEQWQRLTEDKAFPIDAATRDLGFAPRPFTEGIGAEAIALGLTRSSASLPPKFPPPAPPPPASSAPSARPSTLIRISHGSRASHIVGC